MIKIELSGQIFEAHLCFGNLEFCEVAAICEDCGAVASEESPVVVFSENSGAFRWNACTNCLAKDPEVRILPYGVNPETGEATATWTEADGSPIE
jgi:hypothetical protein